MAIFNLKCSDSSGRPVKDETPIKDEDESDFESKLEVCCDTLQAYALLSLVQTKGSSIQ